MTAGRAIAPRAAADRAARSGRTRSGARTPPAQLVTAVARRTFMGREVALIAAPLDRPKGDSALSTLDMSQSIDTACRIALEPYASVVMLHEELMRGRGVQ